MSQKKEGKVKRVLPGITTQNAALAADLWAQFATRFNPEDTEYDLRHATTYARPYAAPESTDYRHISNRRMDFFLERAMEQTPKCQAQKAAVKALLREIQIHYIKSKYVPGQIHEALKKTSILRKLLEQECGSSELFRKEAAEARQTVDRERMEELLSEHPGVDYSDESLYDELIASSVGDEVRGKMTEERKQAIAKQAERWQQGTARGRQFTHKAWTLPSTNAELARDEPLSSSSSSSSSLSIA